MLALSLFCSFLVSAISFIGLLTLWGKKYFKGDYASSLVSFAAGVMLSAAFFDLLPEALEQNNTSSLFTSIFLGLVGFFFLERFVLWFHHHHEGHGVKPSAILILVGDGFHNFLDGVAIAAAFLASPMVGLMTTLAIVAHEIPQEIADFSVLTSGGMGKTKALMWNFISGLTSVLGTLVGFYFLEAFHQYQWALLGFAGGMFIYIASSDLIPELHREFRHDQRWQQTLPFVIGVVVLWVLTRVFAA